ncbi:MAG: Coenzyme F420 hydrogenase/dehydrogenase, beta subunit C-terminal domain [Clostridia bacterium]|nr:Coenzyme F420 hydrogenase/dehydrogenase, beta subunit C-terminal domain [Clostridia bacterium]MDH7572246.1 Coenzyme F420 hydrogenase/dehydrogenase, beta subunit C-terminal domain [Clostridia bacterium]
MGPITSCYLAHAAQAEIRNAGASGGVVSAFAMYLLDGGVVDAVIAAKMSEGAPVRPALVLARTADEVLACAQSKYLPIPVNDALRVVIEEPARYAVIGLPCQVRGIRKAALENPRISDRIKLCIGLFCGFRVSFNATRFWLRKLRVSEGAVASLEFRARSSADWDRGGGGFLVRTHKGEEYYIPKSLFSLTDSLFVSRRCTLCEDLTNEYADLSVGDPGPLGVKESLVLCRTPEAEALLLDARNRGFIVLRAVTKDLATWAHLGNVSYKKNSVAARFRVHKALGFAVPQSQVAAGRASAASYLGALLLLLNSVVCARPEAPALLARIPIKIIEKYSWLVTLLLMHDTKTLMRKAIRRLSRAR